MQLLDGKALSQQILSKLKLQVSSFQFPVSIHVVLVGENPASIKYIDLKQKAANSIGVKTVIHRFPADAKESEIVELFGKLNQDPKITGFFIQLPLPSQFNKDKLLSMIDPKKDIDGLNPQSNFIPAVAIGIVQLLDHYHLLTAGKTAVIINDSKLIGIPLKKLLENKKIKVKLCNEYTQNIPKICRGADIIISATGQKGLVTTDYIKPGAIVVDAAGGDVDFASVSPVCSYITPTYGGVGPMTVACLLDNFVKKSYNKMIYNK